MLPIGNVSPPVLAPQPPIRSGANPQQPVPFLALLCLGTLFKKTDCRLDRAHFLFRTKRIPSMTRGSTN
jgi:hypothetical protein